MPQPPRPLSRGILALVLVGVVALMLVVPLVGRALPLPRRADRSMVQIAFSVGGMLIALVGVLGIVFWDLKRNGRWVDWALHAAGLRGDSYLFRGRRGAGVIHGRNVEAYWVPASRYRAPSFELTTECGARSRLGVGPRAAGGIAEALGRPEVPMGDPALAHLRVTADDADWARALLADPNARAAVLLLAAPAASEARWIKIEPGAIHLRTSGLRTPDITPETIRPAVESLVALATSAERAPQPRQPSEATALERALRNRGGSTTAIVIAVVVLLTLCAAAAAAFMMFAQTRR